MSCFFAQLQFQLESRPSLRTKLASIKRDEEALIILLLGAEEGTLQEGEGEKQLSLTKFTR